MKTGIANNSWNDLSKFELDHVFDATAMVRGTDFIVICKSGGWTEVYDLDFNLLSSEVFLNIALIEADNFITIRLQNGWCETYDKWFNMQSIKYLGN